MEPQGHSSDIVKRSLILRRSRVARVTHSQRVRDTSDPGPSDSQAMSNVAYYLPTRGVGPYTRLEATATCFVCNKFL